ncbi:MAG: VCBS repeat-containing protein [Myxococcota bacterium]
MGTNKEILVVGGLVLLVGCNVEPDDEAVVSGGLTATGGQHDTDGPATGSEGGDESDGGDDGFPDGTGADDSGQPIDPSEVCEVLPGELDAPGPCLSEDSTLAAAFNPAVKWTFDITDCDSYDGTSGGDLIVANLTDDNADGAVDQCDVPDIAFTCNPTGGPGGVALYVLDGATGAVLLQHEKLNVQSEQENEEGDEGGTYHYYPTLAAADVDQDGVAELVWAHYTQEATAQTTQSWLAVEALEGDGTVAWSAQIDDSPVYYGLGISTADLTGGGEPTLLIGPHAVGTDGEIVWSLPYVDHYWHHTDEQVAIDLDDDGTLEVIWGRRVFEADGSLRFELPHVQDDGYWGWEVVVADLDEDGTPELLMDVRGGYYDDAGYPKDHLLHAVSTTGQLIASVAVDTTLDGGYYNGWEGASTNGGLAVADVDGDGDVEAVIATGRLGVAVADFSGGELVTELVAEHPDVPDFDPNGEWWYGQGSVTTFDFLGTGQSQLVRSGMGGVAVFSASGELLFEEGVDPEAYEYGYWWGNDAVVVADIDNDGSAEFVAKTGHADHVGTVASNHRIIAFEDPEAGWAGARRIWNQNSYHVSHVREDGGVPVGQAPSWKSHNTFRVQSSQAPSMCGGSTTPEG